MPGDQVVGAADVDVVPVRAALGQLAVQPGQHDHDERHRPRVPAERGQGRPDEQRGGRDAVDDVAEGVDGVDR